MEKQVVVIDDKVNTVKDELEQFASIAYPSVRKTSVFMEEAVEKFKVSATEVNNTSRKTEDNRGMMSPLSWAEPHHTSKSQSPLRPLAPVLPNT